MFKPAKKKLSFNLRINELAIVASYVNMTIWKLMYACRLSLADKYSYFTWQLQSS